VIGLFIDRLRAVAIPPLAGVDGAEELAALATGTAARHATAFVVPLREDAEGAPLAATGAFRQRILVELAVAIVIRRHDTPKGSARIDGIDALRGAVETALAGWQWDADSVPVAFAASRSMTAGNNVLLHVLTFRTDRQLRRIGAVP
jgi:hypothetical protein